MKRVLITGGNEGIGFEFVRQYLEAGWRVYATCRRPAEAGGLQQLQNLHTRLSVHWLDITIPEDLHSIMHQFSGASLDLLVNNSSVCFDTDKTGLDHIDYERWLRTFEINTLGTMRVIEAMLDRIEAGENGINLIVVLSTHPGRTVGHKTSAGLYYRSSKAALNSAMQDIAGDLRQRKIGLLMLYPGPVPDPGDSENGISIEKSVIGMRRVIADYSPGRNGCFYAYDGSEIPRGESHAAVKW